MSGTFYPETNTWKPSADADWYYSGIHPEAEDCAVNGCLVHAPTDWAGSEWPYFPRSDGRMERLCPHGIGHADPDQVRYLVRHRGWSERSAGTHGCDGCCAS